METLEPTSDAWQLPKDAQSLAQYFNDTVILKARKFQTQYEQAHTALLNQQAHELSELRKNLDAQAMRWSSEIGSIKTQLEQVLKTAREHLHAQKLANPASPGFLRTENSESHVKSGSPTAQTISDLLATAKRSLQYSENLCKNEVLAHSRPEEFGVISGAGCGAAILGIIIWIFVASATGAGGLGFFAGLALYVIIIGLNNSQPVSAMESGWARLDSKAKEVRQALNHVEILTKSLHQSQLTERNTQFAEQLASHRKSQQVAHQAILVELRIAFEVVAAQAADLFARAGWSSLPWEAQSWEQWSPSSNPSFCAAFGYAKPAIADIAKAFPSLPTDLALPAFVPFPDGRGLLLNGTGEEKEPLARAIESLVFRLLAVIPPGKARFTFIDPVGLGNNVASLMSLADHDEMLVNSRAWSEPRHVEQRLGEVTEHMENVIQKYLRQDYKTIHDYNAQAGEVAEPHRFIMVFDFPTNFSDTAARRLVSIAQNGPRCGVYPIILVDSSKPLPHGFRLQELEPYCDVIIPSQGGQPHLANSGTKIKEAAKLQHSKSAPDREAIEIGRLYRGSIVSITNFGAFMTLTHGKQGIIHISELTDFRVKQVEDVVALGDVVTARCIGIDDKGRVKMSRKQAMQASETELGALYRPPDSLPPTLPSSSPPAPDGILVSDKLDHGIFTWKSAPFADYWTVTFDVPPMPQTANAIKETVGSQAKNAARVEVPYSRLLQLADLNPEMDWTATTARNIEIPLGPEGARKVRHLVLGKGTAHHGLIVGRIGSGKSNLMHIIITSLALKYSPNEIQLYLIDFKQGVEFQPYAKHALPHAFAIAVESEREFAFSVMERLEQELKNRGELFRQNDVANIAEYRAKHDSTNDELPRIILLVDEFQEFFREDDHLSRRVASILNQLVLQGRSNGIHVLLGTQSLTNVRELSRGTFDQMGVRIALQCSEADSRLILADDNPAARLLSRPGEAIYNDQAGLIEGNKPFQVAMFDKEADGEVYLAKVRARATEHALKNGETVKRPIVFAGNELAQLRKSKEFQVLLNEKPKASAARSLCLYLGEPVAIRPTTCARLTRQSGSNLLLIALNENEAAGMAVAALCSAVTQLDPEHSRIIVANFFEADSPASKRVDQFRDLFPDQIKLFNKQRDLANEVRALAEESNRRSDVNVSGPTILLFLLGMQRMKPLREDDDSVTYDDTTELPHTFFEQLMKEGSENGIHVISACDTMGNASRCLDRRLMNQIGLRVAASMSESDSSNFLDSPVASRLNKPHRAIFFDESQPGKLEKFIPFGLPTPEFLKDMAEAICKRDDSII